MNRTLANGLVRLPELTTGTLSLLQNEHTTPGVYEDTTDKYDDSPGIFADNAMITYSNWTEAKLTLGVAWNVHVYLIAFLFAVIMIFSIVNLVLIIQQEQLRSKNYFLTLGFLIVCLGSCKTFYMLVDAYNTNNTFPRPLSQFFLMMSFPCLTSAFYLLFSAILKTTKLRIVSPKVFSNLSLAVVTVFNFALSIATDLISGFYVEVTILQVICQIVYFIWGIVFSGAYIYLFIRLYLTIFRTRKKIFQLTFRGERMRNSSLERRQSMHLLQPKFTTGMKITLLTAVFFLAISFLNLYSIIVKLTVAEAPWRWWAYQLSLSICEISMCFTILVVTTRPLLRN